MNTTYQHSVKRKSEKSKSIINQLLLSNYSLAIYASDWREERYFPRAVSLTCFQAFFLVTSAFFILNPTLKNKEDLYFMYGHLAIIAFLVLVYLRYTIERYIKKQRLIVGFNMQKKDFRKISFSFVFTGICFLLFFLFAVLEGYTYVTRYYWWLK